MKDVTGVQYKRQWPTWSDEGCNRCRVQKTVTYLVWWRMWQVYSTKDCDLPGLIKGMTGIQKTNLPGLMKDVTGVQYKRLWPTWSDEGCDRCTVQKTVTNLDWWRTWQVNKTVTYLDWWRRQRARACGAPAPGGRGLAQRTAGRGRGAGGCRGSWPSAASLVTGWGWLTVKGWSEKGQAAQGKYTLEVQQDSNCDF